jgi:hypothetical protein
VEKTPWGWNVLTDSGVPEMSYNDREEADEYYMSRWPYETYINYYGQYSSTGRFNCHGFAWFMSEIAEGEGKDDPRIINNFGNFAYIEDEISYKQVYTEEEADIVWWNTGDHSAITTATDYVWTSKWTSSGPLVTHSWNSSPFGTSNLEYYKRCFYRESMDMSIDCTYEYCKVEFENSSILANVNIEIKYEDWVLIDGTFATNSGATLYIHPL